MNGCQGLRLSGSVLIARLPIGMFPKKCGVYQIKNLVNGNIYVGSSKDIIRRWKEHFREIKLKKHGNKYFQRSVLKYGYDSFECSVLIETDEEHRIENEQKTVDLLSKTNRLYNIVLDVTKLPKYNNNKWRSDPVRIKIASERMSGSRNPMYGYRYTPEQKVLCHDRAAGENNGNFGRKHTEKEKELMRAARRRNSRKYKTEEFRRKISILCSGELNGNYNNRWSEHKKKEMSEKRKGKWFLGDKNGNRKLFDKYKKVIIHLYNKKNKTMKEICSIFDVSQNTMTCFFRNHKIKKKNRKGERNGNRTS